MKCRGFGVGVVGEMRDVGVRIFFCWILYIIGGSGVDDEDEDVYQEWRFGA